MRSSWCVVRAAAGVIVACAIAAMGCATRERAFLGACCRGDTAKVAQLAEFTDINTATDGGKTGLMGAAWYGRTNVVRFLLAHGVRVVQTDRRGFLALDYALAAERETIAEDIMNALLEEQEGWDRERVFISLVKRGQLKLSGRMLSQGIDPNVRDAEGWTALMCAAWYGHERICMALLDGGADPNIQGMGKHRTWPLLVAAVAGHAEIVALLAGRGARLSVQDASGMSAMDHAIEKGRTEVVKVLLKCGVDPRVTFDGAPVVFCAALLENWDAVGVLLDAGASPWITTEGGEMIPLLTILELNGTTNMPAEVKSRLEAIPFGGAPGAGLHPPRADP